MTDSWSLVRVDRCRLCDTEFEQPRRPGRPRRLCSFCAIHVAPKERAAQKSASRRACEIINARDMGVSGMARFAAKFAINPNGCWEWTAGRDRKGYGQFSVNRRQRGAARVSYELFVGPIPDGLQLDHLCRNRACVNPEHLEAVTLLENVRRGEIGMRAAARTHCPHGHPYSPENTYVRKSGARSCRTCRREQSKVRHAAA